MSYAIAKSQYLQIELSEHPYNFFEPKENEGRKIYWHGLPATVKVKHYTWEIAIIPDYTAGLTKEEWWNEYKNRITKFKSPNVTQDEMEQDDDRFDEEEMAEEMRSDYINWGEALSDDYIDWFRN